MKNLICINVFCILFPIVVFPQTQIGQDLNCNSPREQGQFGNSVSTSDDGNIIAVGSTDNVDGGGRVIVYQKVNNNWVQFGNELSSSDGNDRFGVSVSLSANGRVLAVGNDGKNGNIQDEGSVSVYWYYPGSNQWIFFGEMWGDGRFDEFGYRVELSADGNTLVASSVNHWNNPGGNGYVKVFRYANNTWSQLGQTLHGNGSEQYFGSSINLTPDGSILAVGEMRYHGNNGANQRSGLARVYQNVNGTWVQVGQDILGNNALDYLGTAVGLSSDGSILAVGASMYYSPGYVQVYHNVNGTWTQIGENIQINDGNMQYFGDTLSVSSDGSVVIIGGRGDKTVANLSGSATAFKNVNGSWKQMGESVYGDEQFDYLGTSLDATSNATDFVVGIPNSDGTSDILNAGVARVYRLPVSIFIKVFLQGALLNPNSGEESLMRDDLRVAGRIPLNTPYSDGVTCKASVFNTTGPNAIVDWVWVELRDKNNNISVVHSKSALLQRDGDIVDLNGVSGLYFNIAPDDYYISISHRNHLSIISASPISLVRTGSVLDFSNLSSQITFGSNAQTVSGMPSGVIGMWTGDADNDSEVVFSGTDNDSNVVKNVILTDVSNTLGLLTYESMIYSNSDVDLSGGAKFSGTANDTNIIKNSVLNHPVNILGLLTYRIQAQLP